MRRRHVDMPEGTRRRDRVAMYDDGAFGLTPSPADLLRAGRMPSSDVAVPGVAIVQAQVFSLLHTVYTSDRVAWSRVPRAGGVSFSQCGQEVLVLR